MPIGVIPFVRGSLGQRCEFAVDDNHRRLGLERQSLHPSLHQLNHTIIYDARVHRITVIDLVNCDIRQ